MILAFSLITVVIVSGAFIGANLFYSKKLKKQLTDQIQINDQLKQEISHLQEQFSNNILVDSLTGLPSQKIFEDHLSLATSQSLRYQLTFCVMFLDLNGFKNITDALGYDIGDLLLKQVSERLQRCVRQVDTLSRFGSDQFVFIFSQIAKAETAAYIAQRLLDAITQPFLVQDHELYLGANIGIAVFPMDGRDGKTLLKNANLALSQAKLQGRSRYQFYQQEMHALSRRELVLSSSLHKESSYQYFDVYYQPRINLQTKKIVCMEAIVQWQHPDLGLVLFEEFSQLAEKNNNIINIYEWLLNRVCQDLINWREHQFDAQAISIPVSLKQLENTHFIQKVSTMLRERNIDPSCLIFEITESSLLFNIVQVEKMLHMLKHLGVQIAVNNFGAGHLQLQQLRRLPINIFKIDRSFVYDIDTNSESEALVKIIIALANSLQSQVVAEGVENEKQKNSLLALGCQTMQGGLFSPPVLASEFNEKHLQHIHESS